MNKEQICKKVPLYEVVGKIFIIALIAWLFLYSIISNALEAKEPCLEEEEIEIDMSEETMISTDLEKAGKCKKKLKYFFIEKKNLMRTSLVISIIKEKEMKSQKLFKTGEHKTIVYVFNKKNEKIDELDIKWINRKEDEALAKALNN